MHSKRRATTGGWVLGGVMAIAFVLLTIPTLVEAGEAAEDLRKVETALYKLAGRDLTEVEAAEAGKLERHVEELRSKIAEEERAYELRVKYGEVIERIKELEAQDLSPEGTPDRWDVLKNLKGQRQELAQWLERGPRREDPERRGARLRGNLEEYNHAIAALEDQDLSPDGTPDRWETLQNHRAKRREIINALERGMADEREGSRGESVRRRLHEVEIHMEELREKARTQEWTDEEHGQMERLEHTAVELRGVMGKQRGRAEGPRDDGRNEKRRRGGRGPDRPQMRLEVFRLEHADGHHVAGLISKFLPEGSRIEFDENTRHLITLTYGPGVEYLPYLLEHLDAPAVD